MARFFICQSRRKKSFGSKRGLPARETLPFLRLLRPAFSRHRGLPPIYDKRRTRSADEAPETGRITSRNILQDTKKRPAVRRTLVQFETELAGIFQQVSSESI